MKKNIFTTVVMLIIALGITNAQEKYAVLIAGEYNPDNISFPSTEQWNGGNLQGSEVFDEFWNDTYLMWEMLVKPEAQGGKGYTVDNVHVLFANNNDYTFDGQDIRYKAENIGYTHVTDDWGTYSSISGKFNELAGTITENDFLFVWVMSHGGTDATGSYFYSYDAQKIYDTQLATWLNGIDAYKKTVFLSTPSSGGFTNELEGERTIVITSSQQNQSSSRADNQSNSGPFVENEVISNVTYNHGEANYHLYSSLAGETPDFQSVYAGIPLSAADNNNDTYISIGESKIWEFNTETIDDEDPDFSDLSFISNYTEFTIPTILHGTIENDMLCRGIVGITLPEPHIVSGVTFTFDGIINMVEILEPHTFLYFDIGSTTKINDYTEFNIFGDIPWVKGILDFGDYVTVSSDNGLVLQQQNNETIYELTFLLNYLTLYNNYLTIDESLFEEGTMIKGNPIDISITNTEFNSSIVNLRDPFDRFNQIKINKCIFKDNYDPFDDMSTIFLESYEKFNISNSFVLFTGRNGITLAYCGLEVANEVPRVIENNSIFDNISPLENVPGITLNSSYCEIRHNKIIRNNYGIVSYNGSNVLVEGNKKAVYTNETQEIWGNTKVEVFAADEYSFPYFFKWNYVGVDTDESPDVVIKTAICNKVCDISFNYWGEFFNPLTPEIHFSPIDCFKWSPIWYLIPEEIIMENEELLYQTAQEKINQQDYACAREILIQLINAYPASQYAETALKDLLAIEKETGQNYQSLQLYFLNDSTIINNENLTKLGESLANKCLIIQNEYQTALNNYYNLLTDSISYNDSLITLINIEYVNYLIENNSGYKSSTGFLLHDNLEQNNIYHENIIKYENLLLNPLCEQLKNKIKKLKNGKLLQNFPNPFASSTTIYYKLSEVALVNLNVYNYSGQLIKSYNEGKKTKGVHYLVFETSGLITGLYFYNLQVNGILTDSKKMTIIE